jgi:hypothetical protein
MTLPSAGRTEEWVMTYAVLQAGRGQTAELLHSASELTRLAACTKINTAFTACDLRSLHSSLTARRYTLEIINSYVISQFIFSSYSALVSSLCKELEQINLLKPSGNFTYHQV